MSKELIVSVNGREKKIAIVEDDSVTEFYVERGDENQGIVGNIYKGRVMKVLPGMQSAFVDIGLERDSFLYVSDFFDEDLEEEMEEKQQMPRPSPKHERSRQREAARPSIVQEVGAHEEDEEDLQIAALSHIKELSEEPVIEPAPDDEIALEAAGEETAESGSEGRYGPRRRRQRRLRYGSQEKEEPVVSSTAESEDSAETETEAEEESSTRRRPRRPRRRRGSDLD